MALVPEQLEEYPEFYFRGQVKEPEPGSEIELPPVLHKLKRPITLVNRVRCIGWGIVFRELSYPQDRVVMTHKDPITSRLYRLV